MPDEPKAPTPLIVTLVAAGTFQESVELCPCVIDEGEAEKLEPETDGQAVTETVVCSWTCAQPAAPDAVRV